MSPVSIGRAGRGKDNGGKKRRLMCGPSMAMASRMAAVILVAIVIAAVVYFVVSNKKLSPSPANDLDSTTKTSASDVPARPTIVTASSNSASTSSFSRTFTACKPHLTYASSNQWYTILNPNFDPPKFLDGASDTSSNFSSVYLNPENRNASQEWFLMCIQDSHPLSKIACGDPMREAIIFWITNHDVPKELDVRLGLDAMREQYLTGTNGTEMHIELKLALLDESDKGQLWWIES